MGRIIVVDGTSNAGKTTLCDNLYKNMQKIKIIPGASAFARQHGEKYPSIPPIPKCIDEEKENQKFFFNLELDRLIEAAEISKNDVDVFMDRSVLEIISVAYSFESINQWRGIYRNSQILYEKFISIMNERGLKSPDTYLWLQASPEEVIRRNLIRRQKRGQSLSENEWIDSSLIKKQIEFFEKLCLGNDKNKFKLIDTNGKTEKEVLNMVGELLKLKRKERGRLDD